MKFMDTHHAFKVFVEGGGAPCIDTNEKVKEAAKYLKEHGCYKKDKGYRGHPTEWEWEQKGELRDKQYEEFSMQIQNELIQHLATKGNGISKNQSPRND